jgi:hypothetical protein
MKVKVTVTLDLRYPLECVGKRRLRDHIIDATSSWGGQCHPEDPMFDIVKKVTTGPMSEPFR